MSGKVEVFPDGHPEDIVFATPRTVLKVGDHIVVGEDSNAVVSFADYSVLMVKSESEVITQGPVSRAGKVEILKGDLWLNIKKIVSGEAIEVKANLSATGIEGTTIVLNVSDGAETLKVLEGVATFTSLVDGAVEMVSSGETVTATPEGLSEKTTFDTGAEAEQWSAAFAAMGITSDGITYTAPSESTPWVWVSVLSAIILLGLVAIFLFARKLMQAHS
jgi:hypothetical protein